MKLAFALCLIAQTALAAPSRVIVIRHGEKPEEGSELSERGRQRAQALVGYFKGDPKLTPAAIYAMAPKDDDGSVRAIQTVQPLADDLALDIRQSYRRKDTALLAAEIMEDKQLDGKTVLICWEHKIIPDILKAFGWTAGPGKWPGAEVYDRAWVLDFKVGQPQAFKDLPQHLLPGDSAD
ncbi:MAG: histidine phosphatase family protein [Elusimicrobia bacterium]|nr:histidine phosphatase family protein [Elusimicrobiota bacterium]